MDRIILRKSSLKNKEMNEISLQVWGKRYHSSGEMPLEFINEVYNRLWHCLENRIRRHINPYFELVVSEQQPSRTMIGGFIIFEEMQRVPDWYWLPVMPVPGNIRR
jgi:hypothetical protein